MLELIAGIAMWSVGLILLSVAIDILRRHFGGYGKY